MKKRIATANFATAWSQHNLQLCSRQMKKQYMDIAIVLAKNFALGLIVLAFCEINKQESGGVCPDSVL
ncbi:hypothetical protein [Aliagarivorans taiwanensis]|uniref:hypothetical protein n=1 Tax=Aliagarivorans TaxID=882379 RepID=UPI0012F7FE9B|nr:hypothetical protein [Aliagarivorans taiwanensis]